MKWSLYALVIGFIIDLLVGDPQGFPHPVIFIGKLISFLEKKARKRFPQTPSGERLAGLFLWIIVCALSAILPAVVLWGCSRISPWLRLLVESIMCWQILAMKSLKKESMKVYYALKAGKIDRSRQAVSMIVGRDTERLDEQGIIRATVETVAENTSDGVIAPLFYMAIGGATFGFLYKAINTMDSMLGYTDPPYTYFGCYPAKADDVLNFLPSRLSALLMIGAGWLMNRGRALRRKLGKENGTLRKLRIKNAWKIFKRDRYKHASPNSAQTESVAAGLLGVQLAGDAWYHGVLHKKKTIGDPLRPVRLQDIPTTCHLMYVTAVLALAISVIIRILIP